MANNVELTLYSSRPIRTSEYDSKYLALIQNNYFQELLKKEYQNTTPQETSFYVKFLQQLGKCLTPCSLCCNCCSSFPLYQQKTGEQGLLSNFGKFKQIIQPGLRVINPITQKIISIDLRLQTLVIEQGIISKDNVQFKIQSVIFYRVFSPPDLAYKLGTAMAYIQQCVAQISKASLRLVAGSLQIQKIIENRQNVAQMLANQINSQVCIWGIVIDKCSIKQLILSADMVETFSSVALTRRKAQATLISAQSSVESAKLLRQASQILDSKAAMQIRYLEAIEQILTKNQNNIIFLRTAPKN